MTYYAFTILIGLQFIYSILLYFSSFLCFYVGLVAHYLNALFVILYAVFGIFAPFILTKLMKDFDLMLYALYYFFVISSILLNLYFYNIIYSFVKELGIGNFAKIDGVQHQLAEEVVGQNTIRNNSDNIIVNDVIDHGYRLPTGSASGDSTKEVREIQLSSV